MSFHSLPLPTPTAAIAASAFDQAPPSAEAARCVQAGGASFTLTWAFDAGQGLDRPFHDLISQFGDAVVMDLDAIVLDAPLKAAAARNQSVSELLCPIGAGG